MIDILDPTMLRARSEVRCTLLFPAELGPTIAAAVEIADQSARCDIESYCAWETEGDTRWYDLSKVSYDDAEFITVAERYLESRGQILRNPARSSLVRFTETPE